MFRLTKYPALPRLVVVPWLIVWVLTIPLFHLHALDTLEDRLLSQPFLAHTVVSPDLPGEYVPAIGPQQSGTSAPNETLSTHLPRYSELAIAAYSEDDSKRKHGNQHLLSGHVTSLNPLSVSHVRHAIPDAALPPAVQPSAAFPRAPPILS